MVHVTCTPAGLIFLSVTFWKMLKIVCSNVIDFMLLPRFGSKNLDASVLVFFM